MKTLIRSAAVAMLATAAATAPAFSQIKAVNTFGPADSYFDTALGVGPGPFVNQSVAQGFVYGGPDGYFLSQVRLAVMAVESPYTISFLVGADPNSASTLESWSVTSAEGILTLSSVLGPALSNGMTYWLAAANAEASGGWYWNDQGFRGNAYKLGSAAWTICELCVSSAYDVTVSPVGVVATPEPASMMLVATGLFGVLVPAVARRRNRA